MLEYWVGVMLCNQLMSKKSNFNFKTLEQQFHPGCTLRPQSSLKKLKGWNCDLKDQDEETAKPLIDAPLDTANIVET